ncbi:MAG: hypothetical protein BM564_05245 [Bacteroidetes bacterium MedPE-SWsnd-G2]|nr:MAG: hypothetical protein BM564_05245 [Bacteroidetes bacterium MedPE-SWsnd-G2]
MNKVAIIGGSGYIGSYITKLFLQNHYLVKVSVRDLSRKDKFKHLMLLPNTDNLFVSELDIMNQLALEDFIDDCDILIHCGTPFQLDVETPSQVETPTVSGTKNFLNCLLHHSTLKKVVVVASVAALNTNFPFPVPNYPESHVYSELDKPYYNEECPPYARAKFNANVEVTNFLKEHRSLNFELTSVSPVFVIGKPLSDREDSTSVNLLYYFKNNIAGSAFIKLLYETNINMAVVDVQDVAMSIFKTATTLGTHGKNYLLSSESWKVSDIKLMLNKKVTEGGPSIVYSSDLIQKDLGLFFKSARTSLHHFSN